MSKVAPAAMLAGGIVVTVKSLLATPSIWPSRP